MKKKTYWEAVNENIIRINVTILQHKLTIFGIYGISDDENINGKDQFFKKLSQDIAKVLSLIHI